MKKGRRGRIFALEDNVWAQVPVHKAQLVQVTNFENKELHLQCHHLLAPSIL
jgi:hypothetical protein